MSKKLSDAPCVVMVRAPSAVVATRVGTAADSNTVGRAAVADAHAAVAVVEVEQTRHLQVELCHVLAPCCLRPLLRAALSLA